MKRFKNILVYVDVRYESSPALQRAVDLAILNQGRLTVAGVLQELPRDLRSMTSHRIVGAVSLLVAAGASPPTTWSRAAGRRCPSAPRWSVSR